MQVQSLLKVSDPRPVFYSIRILIDGLNMAHYKKLMVMKPREKLRDAWNISVFDA